MNLSLGYKEAILNNSTKYAYSLVGDVMTLKGLGSFKQGNVLEAFGQRYIAPRYGKMTITAPQAADLGIEAGTVNNSVKTHIRVNTTRHSSEWATDFIKRGRPFVFELLVNGGATAASIAAKLAEAFTQYETKFHLSDGLPFTWVDNGDGTLTLTLKDPYLSFGMDVEWLLAGSSYGVKPGTTSFVDSGLTVTGIISSGATNLVVSAVTGLRVGDKITIDTDADEYTITEIVDATNVTLSPALANTTADADPINLSYQPQEPTFDGKYLEENVRMDTMYTSDSYGISPDEKPFIAGGYTQISFKVKFEDGNGVDGGYQPHAHMGITAGDKTGTGDMTVNLYVLDGSDLFTDGGFVEKVVDFLIGGTPAISTFLLSSGEPATTSDNFRTDTLA